MYKLKRVICMAIATVTVVTMTVTGCGTKQESSVSQTSPAATAKNNLPPVELTWYTPVGTVPKDIELVQNEINKYLKDKINATVKLNFFDVPTWREKEPIMVAAGDPMDIMFTASWINYRQDVAKGAFVDITNLIDKYCPNTKALLHPAFLEGSKVNGKNYGIPCSKELAHTFGFFYRADIAEKYNMDLTKVKSYADLEPYLKTIKEKEPNMYPLEGFTGNNPLSLLDFDPVGDQGTIGKLYPNKDTKVINEWDTPEAKDVLRTQYKYMKAGYMRSDAATVKDKNPDQKAGKNFIQLGTLKPLVDEDASLTLGYKFKVVELTKPFITGNDTQGSMQAIYRTSKNIERSLMFLELLNTDKYLNNLVNYGIENTHYVKKSDNVIDFASGLDAKKSGYYPNANWIFGNQYLNYFLVGQNTIKWDKFKEFNAAGTTSKILGFAFDVEPVKTEIAACANVQNEYTNGLGTGTLDPDVYLPKFIDKLKQAGVDRIIAEKQKQIDAWLANGKK